VFTCGAHLHRCEVTGRSTLGALGATIAVTAYRFASILASAFIQSHVGSAGDDAQNASSSSSSSSSGGGPRQQSSTGYTDAMVGMWTGVSLVFVGTVLSISSEPGKERPAATPGSEKKEA